MINRCDDSTYQLADGISMSGPSVAIKGGEYTLFIESESNDGTLVLQQLSPSGVWLDCMRPANCISPEDEDRDTLLACAVLPDPSLSRFPASRAWLKAPLRYARVSSAFARARCHAPGVSSSRGINPSTQGRVARYDSCGNTSNR